MKDWFKDWDFINFLISTGALLLVVVLVVLGLLLVREVQPGEIPGDIDNTEPVETLVVILPTATATLPPTRTRTPMPRPEPTETPVPTNTPTSEPTLTPTATARPSPTPDPADFIIHQVRAGESLSAISLIYYDTFTYWPNIWEATNEGAERFPGGCLVSITDQDIITTGDCVLVPVGE